MPPPPPPPPPPPLSATPLPPHLAYPKTPLSFPFPSCWFFIERKNLHTPLGIQQTDRWESLFVCQSVSQSFSCSLLQSAVCLFVCLSVVRGTPTEPSSESAVSHPLLTGEPTGLGCVGRGFRGHRFRSPTAAAVTQEGEREREGERREKREGKKEDWWEAKKNELINVNDSGDFRSIFVVCERVWRSPSLVRDSCMTATGLYVTIVHTSVSQHISPQIHLCFVWKGRWVTANANSIWAIWRHPLPCVSRRRVGLVSECDGNGGGVSLCTCAYVCVCWYVVCLSCSTARCIYIATHIHTLMSKRLVNQSDERTPFFEEILWYPRNAQELARVAVTSMSLFDFLFSLVFTF